MVEQPRTEIRFESHPQIRINAKDQERITAAAKAWFQSNKRLIDQHLDKCLGKRANSAATGNVVKSDRQKSGHTLRPLSLKEPESLLPRFLGQPLSDWQSLPIEMTVTDQIPSHQGLGSGTQLALTVAMGISEFLGFPRPNPITLATSVGRGQRSAIGSHGFFQGGLLIDRGKQDHDRISPLDYRTDFPQDWPVILILPKLKRGLSGSKEQQAFGRLDSIHQDTSPTGSDHQSDSRESAVRLVRDQLVAGVLTCDYLLFAEALYDFGRHSGQLFAAVQGGVYHSRETADVVSFVRRHGVPAVGQSSWGPGLFAIANDSERARYLNDKIVARYGDQIRVIITRADNNGCRFRRNLEEHLRKEETWYV